MPSPPTEVVLGSVLEGLWGSKVKGRGDGNDFGGTNCPKALMVFVDFPNNIGASPRKLGGKEDGTFSPDEDLDAASSKLTGLLEAANEKACFGSTVVVDPKLDASNIVSVGLLKEKGSAAVGVTSATDAEDTGAKAEPDGGPVAVSSSAGSISCAGLSSERLDFFSPSQKGLSASLRGWVGSEGAGSVGVGDAVKFNTGGTGGVGVLARN
jgi:hypothetical protein